MNNISINCHSSIKITNEKNIYVDPYKIEEEMHDADYIFITHNHYDHYDLDSIKKIIKETTIVIFPNNMAMSIVPTLRKYDLRGVDVNTEYKVNDLCFTTIPSYNINKTFHQEKENWVGYLINFDDEIIYISGDTDYINELEKVECDVALIPIGGTFTMNYAEAAKLINKIKPKKVIPTHYGLIVGEINDGIKFKELIDKEIEVELLIK